MPVSLIGAIKDKYEDKEDDSDLIVFVTKCKESTVLDGLVIPQMVTLHKAEITEAGDIEELTKICKDVTELDLTDNLLTDWSEVFKIVRNVPRLRFLNLSGNKLSADCPAPGEEKESYPKVTDLVLNSTDVPWNTVSLLLKWFPCLEELHLSNNNYRTLNLDNLSPYHALKKLYLSQNQLSEWSSICDLGAQFPNMGHLVLIGNPVEALMGDFSRLQSVSSINISETLVRDWSDLANLGQLENLSDLGVLRIPLIQGLEEKEARQMCIAYLPFVSRLNRSPVGEEERVDAERAFIRRYMDTDKPPRYFELVEKYGRLDPLAQVDMEAPKRAKITLDYMDNKQEVEINLTHTVAEMKKSLEALVGLPSKSFRIYHHPKDGWMGAEPLRASTRHCFSIPIKTGDTLEVVLS